MRALLCLALAAFCAVWFVGFVEVITWIMNYIRL
jgi:hypothetical protein